MMLYDVIIVGAGPAGSTAALYLGKAGKKVLLLDKARFPRDKICGDGEASKCINVLRELDILPKFEFKQQQKVTNIAFSSPNGVFAKTCINKTNPDVFGYVIPRKEFDHILFEEAKNVVESREETSVIDVLKNGDKVIGVKTKNKENVEHDYYAHVVIGADGFQSIVAKKLGIYEFDHNHTLVGTRVYYENVVCDSDTIEMHFFKDIIPGYFWIFPVGDGKVNVGVATTHPDLKEKGYTLIDAHNKALENETIKERFKNATPLTPIKGANLPIGSKRRQVYGNGFLMLGDAAGLIDPFSGEGIGNAMISARIASKALLELDLTNLQPESLKIYHDRLWKRVGGELAIMTKIQKILKYKSFINFITKQAATKQEVADWIANMVAGTMSKKMLFSPKTYLKMIFG